MADNSKAIIPGKPQSSLQNADLIKRGLAAAKEQQMRTYQCDYCQFQISLPETLFASALWTDCPRCGLVMPIGKNARLGVQCRLCGSQHSFAEEIGWMWVQDSPIGLPHIAVFSECPDCENTTILLIVRPGTLLLSDGTQSLSVNEYRERVRTGQIVQVTTTSAYFIADISQKMPVIPDIAPTPNAQFAGRDLSDLDWQAVDLTNADLSSCNLSRANLSRAILIGANLTNSNLTAANLAFADLSDANLFHATLTGVNLANAILDRIAFGGLSEIAGADFSYTELAAVNLWGMNLEQTKFINCNLIRADLSMTYLEDASFKGANLSQANLDKAKVCNADFSNANFQGANLQNLNWMVGINLGEPNFSNANLTNCDLSHADIPKANFQGANLSKANLQGANLAAAQLNDVDFSGANLQGAKMPKARFRIRSLAGAILPNGQRYHK